MLFSEQKWQPNCFRICSIIFPFKLKSTLAKLKLIPRLVIQCVSKMFALSEIRTKRGHSVPACFALLEVYQSTKLRFSLKEVALNKVLLSVYAIMKFFFLPSYVSLKQNSLSNVNFLKQNNHFKIRHGSREPSPFYLSWRAIFELISESLEKVYFMVQMPFRRLATLKRHLLDKPYNHLSGCAGRVAPSNGHSSNYCNYFCIKCAWWNKKKDGI